MRKVLAGQLGLGLAFAVVFWGTFGHVHGYSALFGCLIAVIPNAFLALRLSAPRRGAGAKALMRAAWAGELGKLALTVLLFSLVFVTVRPLAAAPLFATFVVTAMVPLLGLLARDGQTRDTVENNGE